LNDRHSASAALNLRVLFSVVAVLGLVLMSAPASPARPLSTTAQGDTPFPPEGDWYTYANGDDILALELQGDILWAGTRAGGVVRWNTTDGTFVQFLKPQDGLVGNTVRDIFIDSDGHKWFATDHGLSVLDDRGTADKSDDVWYSYTRQTTHNQLPSNRVTAVSMDEAGYLWIGTSQYWDSETQAYTGGGLAWVDTKGNLDPGDDEWLHTYTVAGTISRSGSQIVLGLASDNITDILPVPGNRVWVATQKQWDFRQFDSNDAGEWLPIYGGLSRLDYAGTAETGDDVWKTWACEDGPQRDAGVSCIVNRLKLDANGYVWAAMRGRGVIAFPYDGDRGLDYVRFTRYDGLPASSVESVTFGPSDDPRWQNTVWLGVYDASTGAGSGVCMLNHNGTIQTRDDDTWSCLTTDDGLPDNRVQAMVTGNGKVWMGIGGRFGIGHGISAFTLDEQGFQEPLTTATSGLPYNYITDLAVGQEGTRWENQVWIGTGNKREWRYGIGALLLNTQGTGDPGDDTWTRFTKEGTDDNGTKPWTGLASNNITALAIDGDDVWVGTQPATWEVQGRRGGEWTDGGLSVYDGTQWTIRTDANTGGEYAGMLDDRVSALAIGCSGEVWVALGSRRDNSGLGISLLDTMGSAHDLGNDQWSGPIRYRTIPSNLVTDIAPDCARGQVWISTAPYFTGFGTLGGGVARYDYNTSGWSSWTARDGIEAFTADRSDAAVQTIAVGPDGIAWAGTLGTRSLDRQTLINNRPYVPAPINWFRGSAWSSQVFEGDGWVSTIAVDENGVVWAGTSRGGMDTNADGNEDDSLAGRAVGGIKLTLDGTEWVTLTPDNSPLVTNDIEVIAIAPNGEVWIGTNGWGIMRFRPRLTLGASPTPANTETPTPTPASSITNTPTPAVSPTATRRIHRTYLPLLASDWFGRPIYAPTVAPPTATSTPSPTPPATPTPTATNTPTQAPPTVTPTPTVTHTPTITPTPGPAVWCPGPDPACSGVSIPTFPAVNLYDVAFTDALHGFVVGENGFVAQTQDGGNHWTYSAWGTATLRDIFMVNDQVGFIAGDHKTIWRTTNGGASFSQMQMPSILWDQEEDFWAISAFSANEAWALGHRQGMILRLDGQQWEYFGSTGYPYTGLAMPAPNQGWAIADTGHIYRYDGRWAQASTIRASGALRTIEMSSTTEGWAAGDGGVVVHYANGHWTESRIPRAFYTGGITGLHLQAPDHLWASAALDTGPRAEGAIFQYFGGGWEEVVHTPAGSLNAIWVDETLNNGWAVGNGGLILRYVVPPS